MYIVNISCCVIDKLPFIQTFNWGDTNDRQQAITPTNVDKGLGRRYKNITK